MLPKHRDVVSMAIVLLHGMGVRPLPWLWGETVGTWRLSVERGKLAAWPEALAALYLDRLAWALTEGVRVRKGGAR